jgi:cardiolipin synthase
MIMTAEHHVYIQSPFFILDESISDALRAAALSGVDVRVMVAPRGPGNQLPYWAGRTYIQEMAQAGVRVFFYQKGYFHAKTISIDGSICTIGSTNMDIRSFVINYEASAVIYDEKTTRQLEEDFMEDLAHCTEFSLEAYERRNVFFKLRDSLARLFSPLL